MEVELMNKTPPKRASYAGESSNTHKPPKKKQLPSDFRKLPKYARSWDEAPNLRCTVSDPWDPNRRKALSADQKKGRKSQTKEEKEKKRLTLQTLKWRKTLSADQKRRKSSPKEEEVEEEPATKELSKKGSGCCFSYHRTMHAIVYSERRDWWFDTLRMLVDGALACFNKQNGTAFVRCGIQKVFNGVSNVRLMNVYNFRFTAVDDLNYASAGDHVPFLAGARLDSERFKVFLCRIKKNDNKK